MIRIATSFSPSRILRQQQCLQTWLEVGAKVIAVQSPGETDVLHHHFPQTEFIETGLVGDLFGRPKLVRLKALINQAEHEPVLILNSDIDIRLSRKDFTSAWFGCESKEMKVGVRWNVHMRTRAKRLFKWGVDAFLITPEIFHLVPDIGLTIGCPVWDYWLVWYMHQQGFKISTNLNKGLWHEDHKMNWSKEEYRIGFEIVHQHHGITEKFLTNFVQEVTRRKHIKA